MCLQVLEAEIGPAQAALDIGGRKLILAPGLTVGERVVLSSRLLRAAGQEQPIDYRQADGNCPLVCICGFPLEVSLADGLPGHGPAA